MIQPAAQAGLVNRSGARRLDGAPSERLRLFAPATIVGFGLAVALGLGLIFPHETLEQELLARGDAHRPDRLTVEYLKVFLKAEPREHGLRLALATQLVGLGEFAQAREVMQPLHLRGEEQWRNGAAWLEFEIREQEAFALPAQTPAYLEAMRRMREQMRLVVTLPLDTERMIALGRKALAADEPQVAARAFRQVAARPQPLPREVYADAADTTLALGDYRTSARLYFRSMAQSDTLAARREYYLAGLRALQAASLFDEAIAAADEHLGPLADDRETLLFLTRLAQAGNKPEAAQRYAKKLLGLALLQQLSPQLAMRVPDRRTPAQFYQSLQQQTDAPRLLPARAPAPATGAQLPFDDEAYSLGFQVFLANRNLADALRLAQSAVRQQPDSAVWRKRLAEVSEWSGEPQTALREWLAYARASGDEQAWDAALRLADSLFEQDAILEILRHKTRVDGGNRQWLERLIAQYENAGEPEQALALLRERLFDARRPVGGAQRRQELELFAAIAERSGADAESLRVYRVLQAEFGPSGEYGLRIANHLFRHGKISEAFAALREGAVAAGPDEVDFWRAFAEVARMLQDDEAARAGYRKLLGSNRYGKNDLVNLIASLQERQPRAAAELAAFAYAADGARVAALQAMSLFAQVGDWRRAQRFLATIPPARLAALERDAAFLISRASIRQALADLDGAGRDLRLALALAPDNTEARAGLLWILIAGRDTAALKRALRLWTGAAEAQPEMWTPLAAAHMALNQPALALKWFRKGPIPRDDYLWLLSYAECLDANAQPELAWRVRRHAWTELRRPEVLSAMDPARLNAVRERLAALAPLFLDGDGGRNVIRALLRADSGTVSEPAAAPAAPSDGAAMLARLQQIDALPSSPLAAAQAEGRTLQALFVAAATPEPAAAQLRLDSSARELMLAYALGREAHDLARAWMAARYAGQLSRPLWGELSLLLASDDRPALNRLLDDVPDWLPAYDRIEAAQRAGRPALAQSFAFSQLEQVGRDDEAHLRLVNLVSAEPPAFQTGITQARYFPLRITESRAGGSIALTPGWRLMLALAARRQHSGDPAQLAAVPARDDDVEIGLRRRIDSGYLTASLQRRQAATGTTGARIDYLFSPAAGITVSASAGINQRATESALLRAGGMRSGISGQLAYQFSKTEYARAGLGWHRYASQAGTVLGDGHNWEIEAGSHLRLDYPNLTLRAFISGSAFRGSGRQDAQIARLLPAPLDPASAGYMPAGSTTAGVSLGWGTVIESDYSRGWRPFVEVGLLHDSNDGRGYSFSGGIVGSLFGSDVLVLRGQRSSATSGNQQGQQEIGLNYKWFF